MYRRILTSHAHHGRRSRRRRCRLRGRQLGEHEARTRLHLAPRQVDHRPPDAEAVDDHGATTDRRRHPRRRLQTTPDSRSTITVTTALQATPVTVDDHGHDAAATTPVTVDDHGHDAAGNDDPSPSTTTVTTGRVAALTAQVPVRVTRAASTTRAAATTVEVSRFRRQVALCPQRGLRAVGYLYSGEDVREVGLHGALGDPRRRAICLLASPSATRRSTSSSRALSAGPAAADPAARAARGPPWDRVARRRRAAARIASSSSSGPACFST